MLAAAPSALPFQAVSVVVGALGACLTQAARQLEISTVQLVAATIRQAHVPPPPDAQLAVRVGPFFLSNRLPFQLRAIGVGETDLLEEFEDGVEYAKGTSGRRAIEEKRVLFLQCG